MIDNCCVLQIHNSCQLGEKKKEKEETEVGCATSNSKIWNIGITFEVEIHIT